MRIATLVGILFAANIAHSSGLQIDVTHPQKIKGADLGEGQTHGKNGHTISADSQCIYKDGVPWLPASGEFQFSRYPRADWRDELLKMKAGGIDVIGTYVFWNHIEEQRGVYNWTGQRSLHDFLTLCRDLGLKAFVRIGPWVHGESRNGGFPDWLLAESKAKHFRLRTTDAGYLDCVRPYYKSMADQMKGLLWKDGGPVIAIQVDNECHDLPYLQTLKQIARADGVDVPLYTMTGWAVPVPDSGLIPMFGRYGEAFWLNEGDQETTKSYLINAIRDDGDMGVIGGQVTNMHEDRAEKLARYPHFCIETGGGMQSTYTRRILMHPDDTGDLALCRVASGANLLGYYIFHGGITPDGKYSSLNESTASGYPFDLPLKDYDFNAPITNCGVLRESYHLLREQHLFLQDFGKELAAMPAFFPADQPKSLTDVTTLRWSVRSNGKAGFLFFNNYQQVSTMPPKPAVQFRIKTANGVLTVPTHPITIPSDSYGIWPINQNCSGVKLQYATAQPLSHISAKGQDWYFFKAIQGIPPEFAFASGSITAKPGTTRAFSRIGSHGQKVNFVVLTSNQAEHFWKFPQNHVVLCADALLQDAPNRLRIETYGKPASGIELFPSNRSKQTDGIFKRIHLPTQRVKTTQVKPQQIAPATPNPDSKTNAMDEKAWIQAATWKLPTLKGAQLLRITYVGDVARVYCKGKLIADNFYNGAPFDFGLWRIPANQRDSLEIRIMPLLKKDIGKIPSKTRNQLPNAPAFCEIHEIQALEKAQLSVKL